MSDTNQQAAMAAAFFAGAQAVGMDLRTPPPDLGREIGRITSLRFHQGVSGPGVICEVIQERDNTAHGFRIQLGGKFPQYGIRDTKVLIAAILGYERTDPRAVAIDQSVIAPYLVDGPANPGIGKRIVLNTTLDKKTDKDGVPYRRVVPSALEAADGAQSASAAPSTPVVPTAPAWTPPAGWAPNGDSGWYYQTANPTGEQKLRADLGGPA